MKHPSNCEGVQQEIDQVLGAEPQLDAEAEVRVPNKIVPGLDGVQNQPKNYPNWSVDFWVYHIRGEHW